MIEILPSLTSCLDDPGTLALIKVGRVATTVVVVVDRGSIAGRLPEGQVKYLGRQFARLKRCQENQLVSKERAAS